MYKISFIVKKIISQGQEDYESLQEYRPMTAISIPIFNKKRDEFNKVLY